MIHPKKLSERGSTRSLEEGQQRDVLNEVSQRRHFGSVLEGMYSLLWPEEGLGSVDLGFANRTGCGDKQDRMRGQMSDMVGCAGHLQARTRHRRGQLTLGNLGRKMRKALTSAAAMAALMASESITVEVEASAVGLSPPVDWADASVAMERSATRAGAAAAAAGRRAWVTMVILV